MNHSSVSGVHLQSALKQGVYAWHPHDWELYLVDLYVWAIVQVYVANEGGYMLSRAGVPEHAIITSLANQPTSNLEAFAWVLRRQVRGAQVPVQYYTFSDRHRRRNGIVYVDDTW